MGRKLIGVWTAALLFGATAGYGQDALLEELYGKGVHAFFAQRPADAFNALNAAVRSGSRDPRVFYFRGLALSRLGRPDEARDDFRQGAELEILGGEPYAVGRSLERIQGVERANLETQRAAMRLAIHNTQMTRDRARYEETKRAEGEALRGNGRAAAVAVPAIPPAPADATNPFSPAAPPPPAATPPAARAAPLPPPPATAPTTPDPFAETPAVPATPLAEAPEPAAPAPLRSVPAAPPPAAPPPPAPDPFADAPSAPAPAAPNRPAPPPAQPPADPFADAPGAPAPAAPAPPTPPPPAPQNPAPPAATDPFEAPATPAPAPPPANP